MRLSRLVVLFLVVVLTVAACVPVSTPENTPYPPTETSTLGPGLIPSATSSPTSTPLPTLEVDTSALQGVHIRVWNAFAGQTETLFSGQVAQFNADNQWGVVVESHPYGDYTSLYDAVNTALDSNQTPDLVVSLPEQTLSWNARGVVVDLRPYLVDPKWGMTSDDLADIPAIFLKQDSVNGHQVGLPAQRSSRFIFYNQTWAHELGFSDPPATLEEFRQQACAANASFLKDSDPKNDGYGGWIVDTNWQTAYSWFLAFQGGVVDGDSYTFRTDPNLAALQYVKDLFDSHCAWLSTEPTPFDSFARRSALFVTGDLAEITSETNSMAAQKNTDQWTVIPFPGEQGSLIVTYGPSYTVLKSSPEKQLAAWLFTSWLLSPESQAQWVETTGLFPLRNTVLDMIGPYRQASPQWDTAYSALSEAVNVPQLASWRKVRYVLEDGMNALFQENLSSDKLPVLLTEMDSMAQELK
jgi:multiple sugar transport system substrate-binding protein